MGGNLKGKVKHLKKRVTLGMENMLICPECQNIYFEQVYHLFFVSSLESNSLGSGPGVHPLTVFICGKCGRLFEKADVDRKNLVG